MSIQTGKTVAYYGTIETQARGSLHAHIVLWTAITPSVLQSVAHQKEIAQHVSRVIDSIVSARLPDYISMQHEQLNSNIPLSAINAVTPLYDKQLYLQRLHSIIKRVNLHSKHTSSCHESGLGQ